MFKKKKVTYSYIYHLKIITKYRFIHDYPNKLFVLKKAIFQTDCLEVFILSYFYYYNVFSFITKLPVKQ